MQKEVIQTLKGVSGITRPFKEVIEQLNLTSEDSILYIGLPGVCTPFIELLSYAIRTLNVKQVYVPNVDLASAKEVIPVKNVGIQFGNPTTVEKTRVVVVLGGLAMPISPVSADDANLLIQNVLRQGGTVIGVCFMNMFEVAGWYATVPFDYVIDATIDPVRVEQFIR